MPPRSDSPGLTPLRQHPHLYEINTWARLEKLSQNPGVRITLGQVPDQEWDALAKMGFDLVWLMGMWRRSPESRRIFRTDPASFAEFDAALPGWKLDQVVGSPYAVREYQPDARIATWAELDDVREKLRHRGMRLILDFVPNHTALDHPWTRAHPEYYLRGTLEDFRREPAAFFLVEQGNGDCELIARARDPYFPPWQDVAQINFFEQEARKALRMQLREIANHCDGVRCDMAMLVLNDIFAKTWDPLLRGRKPPTTEFWTEVRSFLPEFILLAEAYWGTEQRLLELGFSFVYDKGFYDALRDSKTAEVRARLEADFSFQSRLARFLENHDEKRSAVVFAHRLESAATLLATAPGMRFYHQGQLEGKKIRLPIPLGFAADEPPDLATKDFYDRILALTREDVFHSVRWRLRQASPAGDNTFENLIVYEWQLEKTWKLIIANVSGATAQARIHLGDAISTTSDYIFFDALHNLGYRRKGSEIHDSGLYVRLDPWRAHLFDISPA
jgi:hypothetical protein